MRSITATELKRHTGEVLEEATRQPVTIEKTRRPVAVLVPYREYELLRALDDAFWAAEAAEGRKSGFLGPKESAEYVRKRLAESA